MSKSAAEGGGGSTNDDGYDDDDDDRDRGDRAVVIYDDEEEEDPFWQIALHEEYPYGTRGWTRRGGDDDDDDEEDDGRNDGHPNDEEGGGQPTIREVAKNRRRRGKVSKYRLPNTDLILELAPLPPVEGIWAPVGADAWYSSALLASMVLGGGSVRRGDGGTGDGGIVNNNDDDANEEPSFTFPSIINRVGNSRNARIGGDRRPFRVVELGSGAMGLPGLACAAALSLLPEEYPSWNVRLTDRHPDVLDQLRANVDANLGRLISPCGGDPPAKRAIAVEPLDWSDDVHVDDDDGGGGDIDNSRGGDPPAIDGRLGGGAAGGVDLVIGSELVYTSETGHALTKFLLRLLLGRGNPSVRIWIVQVVDRYGWSEIVLPSLETAGGIHVRSIPISWEVHEMASSLVRMGGTLDRHAYGAFCITREDAGTERM
jgi:predicted nicotinamide N-methyase